MLRNDQIVSGAIRGLLVYTVTDSGVDGRLPTRLIGHFTNRGAADMAARDTGGSVDQKERLVVQEAQSFFLLGERVQLEYWNPKQIRADALAKLTEEEKLVLGLV